MRQYELTVIVRQKNYEALSEKVKEIINKHNTTIVNEDNWGTRRLAYEISGEKDGYYLNLVIETPTDSIKKIINDFNLNHDILRFLFVQIKKSA